MLAIIYEKPPSNRFDLFFESSSPIPLPSSTKARVYQHPPSQLLILPPGQNRRHSCLDGDGDSSWSPEVPTSRNARPIHLSDPNGSSAGLDDLIAKLLCRSTRAGPVHICLLQDHGDLRVGGRLGEKRGCPGERDLCRGIGVSIPLYG